MGFVPGKSGLETRDPEKVLCPMEGKVRPRIIWILIMSENLLSWPLDYNGLTWCFPVRCDTRSGVGKPRSYLPKAGVI